MTGAGNHNGALLVCQDMHKAFGGVVAVDGMSLEVRPGLITGLIGPNGAGKTTLFNLASNVLKADKGSVHLFGEDVTGLKPHKIARKGMIRTFQLSREMTRLTVLENLMLSPQRQTGEQLKAVFLSRRAMKEEDEKIYAQATGVLETVNLSHVADEYAGNLSGGQKKLLELARALMIDPELILLDEPAAGVNPSLMGLLMDTIEKLNTAHNKTFLIVEHDMDLVARLCHHVIVMAEGRHLTEGTFEEVTHDRQVMEAYLGSAADG